MKVLHLNTNITGGSYEYAASLSGALAAAGVESRVLGKSAVESPGAMVFLNRIVRRATVSLSCESWHGCWRLLSPPGAGELKGVDIVHLHTVGDWFDIPEWLAGLPAGVRVVVSLHDLWHVSGGCFVYQGCENFRGTCSPCPALKPPVDRFWASLEMRRKLRVYRDRKARLVANSEWLAGLVAGSVASRICGEIRAIPPAIDTSAFRPMDRRQCREEMDIPPDAFTIVVGCKSLTDPYKKIEWLLQLIAQSPALKDSLVVAFGDGRVPVPEGLNVRFTGPLSDRKVLASLLAASDVLVSASRMETYGLTLVEAMACGTPVVAFRVGGVPEAAPDGEASILCEPQDGRALLAAIERLREHPVLRETLGRRGSEIAATRNGPEAFAGAFMEVYRECLEDPGAGSRRAAMLAGERSPVQ
jgi:glycosyltransferase involved in cell wall biosynthesis